MTSHVITLLTATYEIRSAYYDQGHAQPFFFVVGAGISAPNVPLAREIIDHCRARVESSVTGNAPAATDTVLDAYSYWFDRAYPQPADRQRYLRSLIHGKALSDASLRLAHVLASRQVGNLVVTSNFDDFISRALNVFGVTHAVSDHPDTVDRIDLASEDIKIVHVHGSYKFYDCRNLRDEVELRARPSTRTTRTMAAFLDRALSFSSPLVIGYGGWEDDVIMSALRRRIEGASLPYRLYWFLYHSDHLADLETRAPWLTNHPDVRIVAPEPAPSDGSLGQGTADSLPLSAQLVLEALSRAFEIGEPEITRDPVGFFARQLRMTLMHETDTSATGGIYSFSTVVARLERAAELESREFATQSVTNDHGELELVRRLLRESKYAQAVDVSNAMVDNLSTADRADLYALLSSAAKGADLPADVDLARATLLLQIAESTPEIQATEGYAEQYLNLLLAKGQALYYVHKFAEALQTFNAIIDEYGSLEDAKIVKIIRYAKSRKALALTRLGHRQEAISLYEEIIPSLEGEQAWLRTQSEFNRAVDLRALAQLEAATEAYEGFINDRIAASDGWTQVLVAAALEDLAEMAITNGRPDDAVQHLTKLVELYGETRHEQVASIVSRSLLQLASLQIEAGDSDGSIRALERLRSLGDRISLSKTTRVAERRLRKQLAGGNEPAAQN